MRTLLIYVIPVFFALVLESKVSAATRVVWVDCRAGNDGNNGTRKQPVCSLGRALALASQTNPAGSVTVKIHPGVYTVAPPLKISRDHLRIEGLSATVRDSRGFLEGFDQGVKIMPDGVGAPSATLPNPLILVHGSDVQFTGLHLLNPRAVTTNYLKDPGSDYLIAIQFEGQWDMANPKALTGEAVRLCQFENWLIAVNVNYASANIESSRAEKCVVPFWFGPAPGGATINVTHTLMRSNLESSVVATGAPEFWTIPWQPCSLKLNLSKNRFEDGQLHFGLELYIRDIFPSLNQPGSLKATIRKNAFARNKLAGISILDGVHEEDRPCDVPYAPVSVHVSLQQNSYTGNGVTAAEPWEHTALVAFQGFKPNFDPWRANCFINHAAVEIADPANELADLRHGTRRFQYRIRPGGDNRLSVNRYFFTNGIPGAYAP
jgi:hypothetical protein